MSDKEKCKDCKYISFTRTGIDMAEVPKTVHYCKYPVPYWALPPNVVIPDQPITCPTFKKNLRWVGDDGDDVATK